MLLPCAKPRQLPAGARARIGSLLAPLVVSFLIRLPFVAPLESALGLVALPFGAMCRRRRRIRMIFGAHPRA